VHESTKRAPGMGYDGRMYERIFGKPTREVEEADVRAVVETARPGLHISYVSFGVFGTNPAGLAEHVAALANGLGGYVMVGVEARDDEHMIEGNRASDPNEVTERVLEIARGYIKPHVAVVTKVVRIADGGYVVVIEVPPSSEAPHMVNGRYPYKQRGEMGAMEPREVEKLTLRKQKALAPARGRRDELIAAVEHNEFGRFVATNYPTASFYMASLPALWRGREVEIERPMRLRTFVDSLSPRWDHRGLVAARTESAVSELALLSNGGEAFSAQVHLAPFMRFSKEPSSCKRGLGVDGGVYLINIESLSMAINELVWRYLMRLLELRLGTPYYISLVLSRTDGYWFTNDLCERGKENSDPHVKLEIVLDQDGVDDLLEEGSTSDALLPLLNHLWQVGGYQGYRAR